jgi:superfamily II DNA or RNA helicase
MSKTIEEILEPKPEVRPRIYAYSIDDKAHAGLLKVGQTTRDVKQRVLAQTQTAGIEFTIHIDEVAERDDGTVFSDQQVRDRLNSKGFPSEKPTAKAGREWVRCKIEDVRTVLAELRIGKRLTGTHHENFAMRGEQVEAVKKTFTYFQSIWNDKKNKSTPRFLWNAKMRFGKTFTAYQLAKKLKAKRVLVMTFKPAVADAWQTDLESHIDFEGWEYRNSESDPTTISDETPLVYFGSLQDLLGRDKTTGNIKPKNKWIHKVKWDLVVLDEYHFGAWRDSAKELVEGEEERIAREEAEIQ